jgi:hypothetical protein
MSGGLHAEEEMSRYRRRLLWLFFRQHSHDGKSKVTQVYPDLVPKEVPNDYVPKIYGFKVYGRKGSKYAPTE